ncbi:MAG: hypothetical protein A2Y07_11550 [Planctomycetes bacterium GWF2_50_10]|nr:MAG: hypothetical protein A2Y07_11550 [Planctomycetes bacterium GWF2_50_10]
MSIKYVLQKNNLVEEPQQYAASMRIAGSVGLNELADRIVEQGTTVRRPDVLAVLENALMAADSMLLDGFRVQFGGLVDLYPKIKGSFEGPTDTYDPSRHQVDVGAMPGKRVRDNFREHAAVEKTETIKPQPSLIEVSQLPAPAAEVTESLEEDVIPIVAGSICTLNGYRLRFNPAAEDEGIYFVARIGGAVIKVATVQKNMPGQLVFLMPTIATGGLYYLEVRTRYTAEGELRIGRYGNMFTKQA